MPVLKYWDQTAGAYVQLLVPGQATAYAQVQATAPNSSAPAIAPPNGFLWVDTSSSATISNLPYFPQQTPPASGFNSFTDGSGEVWVSRNGSAWKKARDVLHARVWRNAAYTFAPVAAFAFDIVQRDPYVMWNTTTNAFVPPVPGIYLVSLALTGNMTTLNQWINNFICLNGTNLAFSGYNAGSAGYMPSPVTDRVLCAAGDSITCNINSSNSSPGVPGVGYAYMVVDYMGTG